jgi:hypothetical protein
MSVHYGGPRDPSFRCDGCLAQWYVPQSVRWDKAELAESEKKAREAGWHIEEYKTLCPQHVATETR